MEILWGQRADGMFTFKSNYSNLFRGRDVCDCEAQGEQGAWALLNPDPALPEPHSQSWDLGWIWHLNHHLHLASWRAIWRKFCYLLWKTTEGDNEAISGMKNVIFAVGFIPHFWVLLFSCRLKASNNPVIWKTSGRGRIKPFISTLIIAAAWVLEINTELGWKMETANATSYLISSIIVSVHVSVEHCLPVMQPIIAAVLTLRADLLLSKHLMAENFTIYWNYHSFINPSPKSSIFVSCQKKFWYWNLFYHWGCVLRAELESDFNSFFPW